MSDMEQYKHELEQIQVSKADKTKPGGSLLSTVIISAGRTPSKTSVTDSSRFAETQQSDPRSEGDWE